MQFYRINDLRIILILLLSFCYLTCLFNSVMLTIIILISDIINWQTVFIGTNYNFRNYSKVTYYATEVAWGEGG